MSTGVDKRMRLAHNEKCVCTERRGARRLLFNSLDYLIFFPIVFFIYYVIPKRFRYIWLLAASYFFYGCWNAQYALLMLTSTLITFASGLAIHHFRKVGKPGLCKASVAVSFGLNLAILVFFKYGNFLGENINSLLTALGLGWQIGRFDILLPVGISFYTFQALGYTMDVYRETIPAERNVAKYALFVSFFPQLVAGPIERSKNLLMQIKEPKDFDPDHARRGLVLILWGLFIKVVVADNFANVVNAVYASYMDYTGVEICVATILFAFQIYCDFAGYTYIARGSAEILNVQLMDNFNCPYLASSVADFWRRWHISLTTWFRDYLYFPLGGNRKGKARKYLNTMIVFLVSGLWHGANWTFVVWGALNGAIIVISEITKPLRDKVKSLLHISTKVFSYKLFQRVLTFLLINITWVFFRAQDLPTAWSMLTRVATDLHLSELLTDQIFGMFYNTQVIVLILFSLLVLLGVDVMKYRGTDVVGWLGGQNTVFRWLVYCGFILIIIVFGVYGKLFTQTQFIYFQF